MTALPTTRKQARALGASKYFPGRPCKHGHLSAYYTKGATCIVCQINKANKWNKAHPEVNRQTQRRLKGLPLPTRPAPDRCECCGKTCNRHLALDHCHTTGRFRGWLCFACNSGLGKLGDTAEGLRCALRYLERLDG